LKVLDAIFVTSAAEARALPGYATPQVALVGRSNVGKSSLINALTRRRIARTSAAPGKTRLANVYRVELTGPRPEAGGGGAKSRSRGPGPWTLYLVDLPGYGYARGGSSAADAFARLAEEYFGAMPGHPQVAPGPAAALLLVDARHPGLDADRAAFDWLARGDLPLGIVATKTDKLGRADRARALRGLERAYDRPVVAASATTGEGLDDLWNLITRLVRRTTRRLPSPS